MSLGMAMWGTDAAGWAISIHEIGSRGVSAAAGSAPLPAAGDVPFAAAAFRPRVGSEGRRRVDGWAEPSLGGRVARGLKLVDSLVCMTVHRRIRPVARPGIPRTYPRTLYETVPAGTVRMTSSC